MHDWERSHMNARIKELAEQARHWAHFEGLEQNPRSSPDILFEQKFAELIVQECIDYCGENLSKTVGGALKIHFGVEE